MTSGFIQILGGLGLFLFGMAVMTGALHALADERFRELLAHTVTNPWKGAVTGALSTAVLQSSSATTVAAVSFVGAGLLTFPESLGIIFGANIGTTITGWLVALVGFKLNLGDLMLPLILLGVLLRLMGSKRFEQIGMTVAGFGLIFVGIGVLQQGLAGLEGRVTPEQFPPDTLTGRFWLILIGMVVTLITQSSSAGVVMALAAVSTGTITLNQAAAMVIGMNVGTTSTAALATIGGNVHARRTGFAHVIYNVLTAIIAFVLLTPYMSLVEAMLPGVRASDPELVLAGFHTFMNTVGVMAVLPFTKQFAALIVRIVPARGNPLIRQLDRSLFANPAVAIGAVEGTLWQIAQTLLRELQRLLRDPSSRLHEKMLNQVTEALEESNDYLEAFAGQHARIANLQDYLACVHVLDHLRRIESRVREESRLRRCRHDEGLARMSDNLLSVIEVFLQSTYRLSREQAEQLHAVNRELKTAMRTYRIQVIETTAEGKMKTKDVLNLMDTARTLRRIGYHLWRIARHLVEPEADSSGEDPQNS